MRSCLKVLSFSPYFSCSSLCLKHRERASTLLVQLYFGRTVHAPKYASTLTQNKVLEFIASLEESERKMLSDTLKKFEAENVKFAVQDGTIATALRWRSEFGRPSKITRVSASEADEKDEAVEKPTRKEIMQLALYNAVPFVGFGFLDNTIMILGGDSIELMVGSVITISTMMAAALGNTLSDIVSIGSAFYVEQFAAKLGVKKPQLTNAQLNLNSTRYAANMGRTVGVTVGCIIGMFPLLFK